MKVLIINGSPRLNGNSSRLVDEMINIFKKEGVEIDNYQIGSKAIRGCMACNYCEFDAYYHSDVAANLVNMLNRIHNAQFILTTHNTRLFSNDFTRPDCCFVHDGKAIKPVYALSDREFRRGDNLERMYRENDFDVNKHSS